MPGRNKAKAKASLRPGEDNPASSGPVCCPIVGIGASAGGLVAFKAFFAHMPDDSGLAFVLVPHLDPTHRSLMVELLSRQTDMTVCEVEDNMRIEANHVYIIPPANYLEVEDGCLRLTNPPKQSRIETAIDHFLRSLALDQRERAMGIVLSGTGSHGSIGLQTIKANGGMAMVQQPDTAEYDAMPQNAIDTGIVDYILPPEKMPATLMKYTQHAYVSGSWQPLEPAKTELEQLDRLLALLKARTGHDFRHYRKNMIMRRVQRRMGLQLIDELSDYSEFLRNSADEANSLQRDMLIGVTGFFREPEAYRVLEQRVISNWRDRKDIDRPIRVWIPGCATGEEAYSIAMLLIENFSGPRGALNLQIFATDIDEAALDFARKGIYPVSIEADVEPERLQRFFTQSGSYYRVKKEVREQVVFAAQNLISDAPFSKLDLISCRNLMIYLEPDVQRRVISLFHFALNEDGHLFLGSSETVGRHIDLFETVSKKWRVFRRIGPTRRDITEHIDAERQSRRLQTILQDSNDAITVINLDGRITDWNRGAEKLYGYPEAQALEMTIFDLLPQQQHTDMQKLLKQSAPGREIKSFDSVRVTRDGRSLEVWVTLTQLFDKAGQMIAVATTERDLSERRELDSLRVQTERLLEMVEHLPVGAVYREKDQLRVNQAVEEVTGYSRVELATMDQWFNKLYGARAAAMRQQFEQERDAGFPSQYGPVEVSRKDGEARFVDYAAYRFNDHEVWIMHDVSKRHEAEAALHDREERLHAVMDNAAEAIVVIDIDGKILSFNLAAEQLFGYRSADVIGQNVSMLMPSPYREAHDGYLARYKETGVRHIIGRPRELPGRRKDKSTFPMLLTVTEADHLGIYIGIIHDLSMQRNLEKQIASVSTLEREEFGREVHDGLCQQLAALSMYAKSLKQKLTVQNLPEAETMGELVKWLHEALKDARVLAHGLAPVPITSEGLEDALAILARDVTSRSKIECIYVGHDVGKLTDRTDAMQVYRIAQEAVNNVIKHAKATRIDVTLNCNKGRIELTIHDNGCGFSKEKDLKESLGIPIMRYRAGIIGNTLEIESSAQEGTTVRCMPTVTTTHK